MPTTTKARLLPQCRKAMIALLTAKTTAELKCIYRALRQYATALGGISIEAFDARVEELLQSRAHNLGAERLGDAVAYVYAARVAADGIAAETGGLWSRDHELAQAQIARIVRGPAERRAVA